MQAPCNDTLSRAAPRSQGVRLQHLTQPVQNLSPPTSEWSRLSTHDHERRHTACLLARGGGARNNVTSVCAAQHAVKKAGQIHQCRASKSTIWLQPDAIRWSRPLLAWQGEPCYTGTSDRQQRTSTHMHTTSRPTTKAQHASLWPHCPSTRCF